MAAIGEDMSECHIGIRTDGQRQAVTMSESSCTVTSFSSTPSISIATGESIGIDSWPSPTASSTTSTTPTDISSTESHVPNTLSFIPLPSPTIITPPTSNMTILQPTDIPATGSVTLDVFNLTIVSRTATTTFSPSNTTSLSSTDAPGFNGTGPPPKLIPPHKTTLITATNTVNVTTTGFASAADSTSTISATTTAATRTILTINTLDRANLADEGPSRTTSRFTATTIATFIMTDWSTFMPNAKSALGNPSMNPSGTLPSAPSPSEIAELLSNESTTNKVLPVSQSDTPSSSWSVPTAGAQTRGASLSPSATSFETSSKILSTGLATSATSVPTSSLDRPSDYRSTKMGTSDILAITFGIVSFCLVVVILCGVVRKRRRGVHNDSLTRHTTAFQGDQERNEARVPFDPHIWKAPLHQAVSTVPESTERIFSEQEEESRTILQTTQSQTQSPEPYERLSSWRPQNLRVQRPEVTSDDRTTQTRRPSISSDRTRTTFQSTQPPVYGESLASNEVWLAGGPVRTGRAI